MPWNLEVTEVGTAGGYWERDGIAVEDEGEGSLVGFLMLMGQIPIRHGMRVILGCFVLLGAPVIAAGLAGAWQSASPPAPDPEVYVPTEVREPLPPADYDPYAGASLRRE